ncbi:MAG TPA: hypothetical protein VE783_11445 [Candidatus Limnocylindrales bacterium]|jgi:hypothetical protein|nr:hypothetical protein [Candidatus Limnocylindrales bacterium]
MKFWTSILLGIALLTSAAVARKRDPLTDAEADKIRQVRLEPYKRLKLYAEFTEARLDKIDSVRNDPKEATERGVKIHDLLEDFSALIDEINENIDMYQSEPLDKDQLKDYKKGLRELTAAENRFGARLRALKNDVSNDPQAKAELPHYQFVLQDAQDAVKSSLETVKEYAAEKKDEKAK